MDFSAFSAPLSSSGTLAAPVFDLSSFRAPSSSKSTSGGSSSFADSLSKFGGVDLFASLPSSPPAASSSQDADDILQHKLFANKPAASSAPSAAEQSSVGASIVADLIREALEQLPSSLDFMLAKGFVDPKPKQ